MPIRLTTRKSSGRIYADLRSPDGKRVRLALKTTSKRTAKQAAAEAQLAEIESALHLGRLSTEAISRLTHGRKVTLQQAVNKFAAFASRSGDSPATTAKTLAVLNRVLAAQPKLGASSPAGLTHDVMHDFINAPGPRSASTRTREVGSLRSFCRWMVAAGLAPTDEAHSLGVNMDPLSHEQRERTEWQPFTEAEQTAILTALEANATAAGLLLEDAAAAAFFLAVCRISRATAMRLSDCVQLEWACLTQPGAIAVWMQKVKRRVSLPINEQVAPGLAAALAAIPFNDTAYLFPEMKARYAEPAKRAWFSITFGRVLARVGITAPGKSFHSWRHTAVSRWAAQGFNPTNCAAFAGHANVKTTAGYTHP